MLTIKQVILDVQSEFQGAASFSIDWYNTVRRAMLNMKLEMSPHTLNREAPIYGGLAQNIQIYFCPTDLKKPNQLYTNRYQNPFDFVPPNEFYRNPNLQNRFTIETSNGVRVIVVRHPIASTSVIIDKMDGSTTTYTGVPLTENPFRVLPAAQASMTGLFSDTNFTVANNLTSPISIAPLTFGIISIPMYIPNAANISTVALRLYTNPSTYTQVSTSIDTSGNVLRDGWNILRFDLQNRLNTGTPDISNIVSWALDIQQKTSTSQNIDIGSIVALSSIDFMIKYSSDYAFVDSTTMAWMENPTLNCYVNIDDSLRNILHYETCMLITQAATTEKVNPDGTTRFSIDLAKAYQQYFEKYPTDEQPLSYSQSPDIALHPLLFGYSTYDIEDRIGNDGFNTGTLSNIVFVDNFDISPTIIFNGSNRTFTLPAVPNPPASLNILLAGSPLTLNVDYSLSGATGTFLWGSPPSSSYQGQPFTASFRYLR